MSFGFFLKNLSYLSEHLRDRISETMAGRRPKRLSQAEESVRVAIKLGRPNLIDSELTNLIDICDELKIYPSLTTRTVMAAAIAALFMVECLDAQTWKDGSLRHIVLKTAKVGYRPLNRGELLQLYYNDMVYLGLAHTDDLTDFLVEQRYVVYKHIKALTNESRYS